MRSTKHILMVGDAAAILGKTTEGVRHIVRTGRLRAFRTASGVRLFLREDVVRLAAERRADRR